MKKAVNQTTRKSGESETEMLARLVQNGFFEMHKKFEQIDKRFEQIDKRFDQVDKRFEQVDKRFDQVDKRFERIEDQIVGVHHELKDHSVRLERIERKQAGMLISIDESVHRSEFKNLLSRVEALEKKSLKK